MNKQEVFVASVLESAKLIVGRADSSLASKPDEIAARLHDLRVIRGLAQEIVDRAEGYK